MPTSRIGNYLRVHELPNPGRKTKRWAVLTNHNDRIGEISWYTSGQQYTLDPEACTTWNAGCLTDIVAFLERQNKRSRASGRKPD